MSKLNELLVKEAIILNLDVNSSSEVIEILGNRLKAAGYVHKTFVQGALDRESRLPTGLPLGGKYNAAIPHTEVQHVKKAGLALATLKNEVTFKNMVNPSEEVPVKIVFVMALSEPHQQVSMLQEIAGVLQNEDTLDKLISAKTSNEIIKALQ